MKASIGLAPGDAVMIEGGGDVFRGRSDHQVGVSCSPAVAE